MAIGKQTRAKFAFYTPQGERRELFFSIMGFRHFAESFGWYLTSSGFRFQTPNAQLYAYDPDTHECVGYYGYSHV